VKPAAADAEGPSRAAGQRESSDFDRLVQAHDELASDLESVQRHRVESILLVASLYDSFTLSEGQHLAELLFGAYHNLGLYAPPHVRRVSTHSRALEVLADQPFDLVIAVTSVSDVPAEEFREHVRRLCPDAPVFLMAFDQAGLQPTKGGVDRAFLWRGDVRLLVAIIKLVEDARNAAHDAHVAGVQTIILVEDSVKFYSAYLPMLFTEVVKQTDRLISESANTGQRLLRLRLRPRVLLACTYEEAWELYTSLEQAVLCLVSDVRFPRAGQVDPTAGLTLLGAVRKRDSEVPLLLQSSRDDLVEEAERLAAGFLWKNSPTLLHELRQFMLDHLGFGDFVFREPDGREVARAHDVPSMLRALRDVPDEALLYHGSQHHFSNWLKARTEFALANALRKLKVSDFQSVGTMRTFLTETFTEIHQASRRGQVTDFDPQRYDEGTPFVRIGAGSLGGKGRGLAFVHELLNRSLPSIDTDGGSIFVPRSAVIATDVFEAFVEDNALSPYALHEEDDAAILARALNGTVPARAVEELRAFLTRVSYPIAVRSSSLLEDSHHLPAAGIYATHMLPNDNADLEVRLRQLLDAVRHIFASTFFRKAKAYLRDTPGRVEDEKMAVVVQQLVGQRHGPYVYPTIAGVAQSHNVYPIGRMAPEDGVATVALGLGRTVVDGGRAIRFSPARPQWLPQLSTVNDILANAQREFWALDMDRAVSFDQPDGPDSLVRLGLAEALSHGVLDHIGSIYSPGNDAVYPGVGREGVPLVTFAPILKAKRFPLAATIRTLLDIGEAGMAGPVEIEFAANLPSIRDSGSRALGAEYPALTEPESDVAPPTLDIAFLQIRPQRIPAGSTELGRMDPANILVGPCRALGGSGEPGIRDVIAVPPQAFDRARGAEAAEAIGRLNAELDRRGRRCVLIGPGRWGSADRWLGIPVNWDQICAARVIVECPLEDIPVEPSEGAHFFHNIVTRGLAFLIVGGRHGGTVDWEWLNALAVVRDGSVFHAALEEPLEIRVDGRTGRGVVLKCATP
jgi:hypothetical protein